MDLPINSWLLGTAGLASSAVVGSAAVYWYLRRRGMHRWLLPYLLSTSKRRAPRFEHPVHLLLAICDHYEPKLGKAPPTVAKERVHRWAEEYPKQFAKFKDSDGRPPRHTFFYPIEEYEPEYLDALAELCRAGFGEVEIHLHHDNDTANNLRRTLLDFKKLLRERHGLLGTDRQTGEIAYGFIHGNWALDNSRSDGRWCGVNNELDVLRETGCYADFTLPSAPSETQTRKINSIYWAVDNPSRPKSHDWGPDVGAVPRPTNSLLMVQGPLVFDWTNRKFGLVPKIENACIQGNQPPSMGRLSNWLKACIQVPTRPDWYFVKLHTHGANEQNMQALLGNPMLHFHQGLAELARREANFHFHYVSAREMANLALAAGHGWKGNVAEARDECITF